jgi:hypothetical protein
MSEPRSHPPVDAGSTYANNWDNAQREAVSEIGSATLDIEAQADLSNIQEGTSSGKHCA